MSFLREILSFWKATWQQSKIVFFVEAASTIMGMVAAVMINFTVRDPDMMTILILYCISGAGLTYTSFVRKTPWMVILMGFYTLISFVGIYKLLF